MIFLLEEIIVGGQSVSKISHVTSKNEGYERLSGKLKQKKEMDNPLFL